MKIILELFTIDSKEKKLTKNDIIGYEKSGLLLEMLVICPSITQGNTSKMKKEPLAKKLTKALEINFEWLIDTT
ncbi:MAG: hypothetical protein V4489_02895 [Chlamydiota bacterium]